MFDTPCWIFCYPTLELYNVLNATCVLVGHNLLDLLEYTHTVGVVDNLFLFCPTLSTGLKIRVRLFSLRLRTVGDYNVHCSNTIWLPQSTLFACMTWGFWTGNLLKLYLYTVSSFYYYYYYYLFIYLLKFWSRVVRSLNSFKHVHAKGISFEELLVRTFDRLTQNGLISSVHLHISQNAPCLSPK